MEIPKRFKIGAHEHIVHFRQKIRKGRTNGRSWLGLKVIELARENFNGVRTHYDIQQTFWHEVVHSILGDMGHALNRDEDFVDALADRLNQIVETAEFDDGPT